MVLTGSMLVRRFSGKIIKTMKKKKQKPTSSVSVLSASPRDCRCGSATEGLPGILHTLGNAQACRLGLQETQACMSSVLDILDFAGFLLFDTVPCSPGWLVILFLSLPCAVITSLHHHAQLDCVYPSVCTAHAVVSVGGGRGCSVAEQQHEKLKTVSRKSSVYLEKLTHSRLLPAKNPMPEILCYRHLRWNFPWSR